MLQHSHQMEREQSEFCNLKVFTDEMELTAVKNTGKEIAIVYVYEPLKMSFKDGHICTVFIVC